MCRYLEIAESTWHRWLAQYGGMKANDAKRLKELEAENARLKKLVAEAELDKLMLREIGGRSYRSSWRGEGGVVGAEGAVDLSGELALQAADDLGLGEAFCGAALDVGKGLGAVAHADDHGDVERPVGGSVSAAVEAVSVGLAR